MEELKLTIYLSTFKIITPERKFTFHSEKKLSLDTMG